MAIQFIDNQPLTWRTTWATDSDCKTDADKACTVYSTNDYLFAQWKQTPCGVSTNVMCNPDFTNSNPEKVSNGEFTTNTTGWTLGTGVVRDAANERIQFPGTTLASALSQTISFAGGDTYDVTFTIGGMTGGSITPYLGGAPGTAVSAAGTYTQAIQAPGNNLVFETTLFDGWIDDISIQRNVLEGGCWAGDIPKWNIQPNGTATKIPSLSGTLTGTINSIQTGGYYKLTFKVSGLTAGQFTVEPAGAGVLGTITGDGYYEYWFTANGSVIYFHADTDCNGTLSDFDVRLYSNYYTVILKDTKNNTQADLSGELELFQDWVTIKYQLGDVDPGCYELCVYDACGYSVNDSIITDNSFNDATKWDLTASSGGTQSIAGGKLTWSVPASAASYTLLATSIGSGDYWPAANTIVFDWTITTGASTFNASDLKLDILDPDLASALSITGIAANTTYSGTYTFNGLSGASSVSPYFTIQNLDSLSSARSLEILAFNVTVQAYVPGQMQEYCSNCIEIIDYPDADKCTIWVGGTNGADAFGFHFDPTSGTPFQVGARVRAMLINPKYTGDHKRYTTATGKNIVTASSTDKVYTLFIDYTDEHTHDWLRIACLSDTLRIGAFSNTTAKYVGTDGDYSPEWPDNIGNWPAAQARVEVIAINDTLYNNNAG